MRVVVVGGSGLIGAHVVDVLRERGHEVTAVARTARPGIDRALDAERATVAELRALVAGHDGVVYAARTDEAKPLPKPIYPGFRANLVEPLARLFTAARDEGLTRGALMGSYYTYFHRLHPQWRLPEHHTYIRCRVEQAAEARAAAGAGLPVAVVELPFVLGEGGGRLPNWSGPWERWARSGAPLFAPDGGTAAVSARSVAETTAGALERASGEDLPVADQNLTWRELFARIAAATGRARTVHRLPGTAVRVPATLGGALMSLAGRQSGIDPAHFGRLALTDLYVEPVSGRSLDAAIRQTVRAG
ncbi:NAD-dependent epimerase/dehydratase family protein [Catenuloplanes atrovinosus]|uniref:Nucleoside-diphosphate-sugar epimerase n=1 Tax=Catenuloplanes atrovinosus TaxID=137266 RepID=A0AAE3YL88_9ACTN|nr:NAD(P)H-binding protein [Catenuloplanes atrovinosus]MDR7274987.1 nucleoside-diphosphate-sugar epimerase [Catenuloplanes atrovinosus]